MPSPKPEILVLGPIPGFESATDEGFVPHLWWDLPDSDTFLGRNGGRIRGVAAAGKIEVGPALLSRLPRVEIIASFGVGYDRIDVAEAARRGIVVTNTPDVLTEEVADLTLGLLIATLRRLPQADRFVRNDGWSKGPFPLSPSLRGRRVGIVGLGRIGKAIARRLDAALVEVAYHGRSRQDDVAYSYHADLTALAAAVDTLILAAPGGEATRHLVNARVLSALGPNGVLINVGRGSLVDEQALIAALESGAILAAGLDVFEDEPNVPEALRLSDRVVLLPHLGSASVHTRDAMGRLVLDNLRAWFSGRGPLTPVPETPWRDRSPHL
jgi:lactate dehydrogenase-like 2-hydroxyacid dehydrogenase